MVLGRAPSQKPLVASGSPSPTVLSGERNPPGEQPYDDAVRPFPSRARCATDDRIPQEQLSRLGPAPATPAATSESRRCCVGWMQPLRRSREERPSGGDGVPVRPDAVAFSSRLSASGRRSWSRRGGVQPHRSRRSAGRAWRDAGVGGGVRVDEGGSGCTAGESPTRSRGTLRSAAGGFRAAGTRSPRRRSRGSSGPPPGAPDAPPPSARNAAGGHRTAASARSGVARGAHRRHAQRHAPTAPVPEPWQAVEPLSITAPLVFLNAQS